LQVSTDGRPFLTTAMICCLDSVSGSNGSVPLFAAAGAGAAFPPGFLGGGFPSSPPRRSSISPPLFFAGLGGGHVGDV
jgi:hypothetical protein